MFGPAAKILSPKIRPKFVTAGQSFQSHLCHRCRLQMMNDMFLLHCIEKNQTSEVQTAGLSVSLTHKAIDECVTWYLRMFKCDARTEDALNHFSLAP